MCNGHTFMTYVRSYSEVDEKPLRYLYMTTPEELNMTQDAKQISHATDQMSCKKGLRMFGEEGKKSMLNELLQLHGDLKVKYCPTERMWADLQTKPLQGSSFRFMRKWTLNYKDANLIRMSETSYHRSVLKIRKRRRKMTSVMKEKLTRLKNMWDNRGTHDMYEHTLELNDTQN